MKMFAELRGMQFLSEEGQDAFKCLGPGSEMKLKRDPTNKFDKNAIRVMDSSGVEVGWVSKEHAKSLAPLLDKGLQVRVRIHTKKLLIVESV
jgi:hypothetical protein